MKLSPARPSAVVKSAATAALFSLALLVTPVASISLDCKNILVDGHKFNFGELEGPHSVLTWQQHGEPYEFINTTYTFDLCRPLVKKAGADDHNSCPNGARVCGIRRGKKFGQDDYEVFEVRSIAGDLADKGGGAAGLDERVTLLDTDDLDPGVKKVGVSVVMSGGRWPLMRDGREQRAIIEMVCNPDLAGTEGEVDPTGDFVNEPASRRLRRADGNDGKEDNGDGGNADDGEGTTEHQLYKISHEKTALIFKSYGPKADNGNVDVLHLKWYTKLACEGKDQTGGQGPSRGESWGFFTWLFLLAFMGTAAYLIFGSWLNYNRYGARGWDLLPHGDTIRDIPYLLKDWSRRVMNTVQGTGSRGGYSAI